MAIKKMTKGVLAKLEKINGVMLASIYIPLEKGVKGHKHNQSLFHEVRAELKKKLPKIDFERVNPTLDSVLADLEYSNDRLGVALFVSKDKSYAYSLPFSPILEAYFSTKLYTVPIKEYYKKDQAFYVLAISGKGSKLYHGNIEAMEYVPVKGLGKDMESTLRIDEKNTHTVQSHSSGLGGSKQGRGFHGHGGFKDIKKSLYEEYLRTVDKLVNHTIKNKNAPLVLVGVDYGRSAFKRVSKYPVIFNKGVSTSPDTLSTHELYERTRPLLFGTI